MGTSCGAAAVLRPGGPVRVPFRECCVAALLGAPAPVARCAADAVEDDGAELVAPVEVVEV
jgi:hypothetical protein